MIARLPLIVVVLYCAMFSVKASAQKVDYILDMVHNNPGEPLTKSSFNNSSFLATNGYNGKVMNDFIFPTAAVKFKKLNPNIFPAGSIEAKWVDDAAAKIRTNIKEAHAAGIKIYYFTDVIVLPKKLVEIYQNEICDANGKISFEQPKTIEIHKIMLDELFETFPDLDGLVIRTGETYTNNVPYHTGNNPITNGAESHIKLLNLLREEVCVKLNKQIFYRTWSFGGMHDDTAYYLKVTNQIETHPNLVFSIKHTKGDYHRTYDFNPTIGLGKHKQIIEVQCQREYEGKGAYPNYVMNGVIDGFEEYSSNKPQAGNKSLNDIKNNKNFAGVWSWSRGGGWVGPYISNELWPRLNAYVISHWAVNTSKTEEQVFNQFMNENGVIANDKKAFRQLALLSAKAVIRGHSSVKLPFDSNMVFWMRDEFLSGIEPQAEVDARAPSEGFLYTYFQNLYNQHLLDTAIAEKKEAVKIWQEIVSLSNKIHLTNKADEAYVKVSSKYGLLLHQIIAEGWNIMAMGFVGDNIDKYNYKAMDDSIKKYDVYWKAYEQFKSTNSSSATLYKPYAFVYQGPTYHLKKGMDYSIEKYRSLVAKAMTNIQ
ncbi:MAG: hypothetical protein H7178_12405 [Chitinophagaceae bacterium]|nr:hypothetical protein [Chitinophagaceae bacterium]